MKLRKFLLLLLSLCALPSLAYDFAVENEDGVTIYYEKRGNNTAIVTYQNTNFNSYSENVTIPETVTYDGVTYSVTSIGFSAFRGCLGLTSMIIPNFITSIDSRAFDSCSNLKTLTIEDNEKELNLSTYSAYGYDYYSFKDCQIENLYIGRNLSSWSALCNTSSLKKVEIGNAVTSIGDSAFRGCSGLTEVTIPNSITAIGDSAFRGCSGLTSIIFPDSVTSIGSHAFSYCNHLAIDLSKSEMIIQINSFNSIKSLIVGEKVVVTGSNSTSDINVLVWLENSTPKITGSKVTYTASSFDHLSSRFKVDGFTYVPLSFSERTCMLIDCDYISEADETVVLPEKVIYKGIEFKVVQLGDYLMARQDQIFEVKLRDSDEIIPDGFFVNCSNLQQIEIPECVTAIGMNAFSGCSSLVSVTIPNSVTTLGESAFSGCSGMITVTIPNSVSSLGKSAFSDCTSLSSVSIPNSLTSIVEHTFSGCSAQAIVTIPNSITSIGSGAFYNCSSLDSINIGNSVTYIGPSAFNGCSSLTSVTIGNSVDYIGNCAFENCSDLISVNIPNSVNWIGYMAFYGCNSLTNLCIEDGETLLTLYSMSNSDYSFKGCTIENLYVGRNLSTWRGLCNSSNLKKAEIGNFVSSIGDFAFYDCSGLTSVNIGNTVATIGASSFCNCSSLTSVIFSNSVTLIDQSSFRGCSGLTSITIPASVAEIGYAAFGECTSLKTLNIDDGDSILILSSYYSLQGCTIENLYVGRNLTYWWSLSNGSSLKNVSFGHFVTEIGESAFYHCSGLTSVTFPNSIVSIGNSAFSGCIGLTSVTIPASVTEIEEGAFSECSALKKASLLDGVDNLKCGSKIFNGTAIEDVLIGRSITGAPFREMTTLKTAWITDIVTEIPDYLFYHCSALENLYVGDEVTKISDWAFSGCYGLKLFNFGKNITHIGNNAISDCSGMVDIYAEPTVPPTVYTQGLDDINKWECTLHYPAGAPYMSADQWKEFLFADNDFMVTMPEETMEAEAGDVITVTAIVEDSVVGEEVVWRSSNPEVAEIVEGETLQSTLARSASSNKTISVNVLVHKKEQVTIAAFLPTGQMANCIINKGQMSTSVPDISITPLDYGDDYTVYNLQGVLVMRTSDSEQVNNLPSGIYIINGKKVMVR